MRQYVKIYCCGDCIYYKRHKCVLGAHDEGTGKDRFFRDCPLGICVEDDKIERQMDNVIRRIKDLEERVFGYAEDEIAG